MKRNVWMAVAVIVLLAITAVNVAIYATDQATIKIKGTGDGFKSVAGNVTTWGCDRTNSNQCEVTVYSR